MNQFIHRTGSRRQAGLSILETMIAMTIGLVITGAVASVYQFSTQTSRLQTALSQIQENGRFALDLMTRQIRMAGYGGCYSDLAGGVEITLNSPTNFAWDLTNTIQGFDNVASSTNIGGITGFIAGTDVVVVRGMDDGVPLSSNPNTATFTIAAANNRFSDGDILAVSDCGQASVFQATSLATVGAVTTIAHISGALTPGNGSAVVNNRFANDAEIGRLETNMYYIKNDSRGRPALYQATLAVIGGIAGLQEIELIDGVDNLQILYGVDNDADRDTDVYLIASNVTDWRNVLSLRVAVLLASSSDFVGNDKQSYSFDTTQFTFIKDATPSAQADRRVRRSFSGFMALRNRTL